MRRRILRAACLAFFLKQTVAAFASEADLYHVVVKVTMPDLCGGIEVEQVLVKGSDMRVIARITGRNRPEMACAAAIGEVQEELALPIKTPESVTYIILGKDWNWEKPGRNQGYVYSPTNADLKSWTDGYKVVFSRTNTRGFGRVSQPDP